MRVPLAAARALKHQLLKTRFSATVRALASQGGEVALDSALFSTGPVQTNEGCLHPFAAATHIPAVALPTGLQGYYTSTFTFCQPKFHMELLDDDIFLSQALL